MRAPYIDPSMVVPSIISLWKRGIYAIITNLKSVVEVSNLTQVVQKLVNPRFVIFNEGIEGHHVGLLRVRRFVGQVLKHLGDLLAKY